MNGLRLGMLTAAIVLTGLRAAAQPAGPPARDLATPEQQRQQERAQQTESGRAGREEPSARAPTSKPEESAVLVDGRLAVPGAPADSQTVPSKYSQRNAALDEPPIMAVPPPFTDEQTRRIRDAANAAPVVVPDLCPSDLVPSGVEVRELPSQLVAEIPLARNLGYVRTTDRVLLVKPASRIVVGEIPAR